MNGTAQELNNVLARFSSAILVTLSDQGLRGRPLAVQQRQGHRVWMCTSGESDKAQDIRRDPRCALLFHAGGSSTVYASLAGSARIVRDPEKVHELWTPAWRAWFPEGPEQKDLVLLLFEASHAEYANPVGGKLGVMASALKRILTGEHIAPKSEKSEVDLTP